MKEELINELNAIADNGGYDQENNHVMADELLLKYIDDSEIKEAYDKIDKWYA